MVLNIFVSGYFLAQSLDIFVFLFGSRSREEVAVYASSFAERYVYVNSCHLYHVIVKNLCKGTKFLNYSIACMKRVFCAFFLVNNRIKSINILRYVSENIV